MCIRDRLDTADAPQSYEELLDFAGRWAERVEAGEAGNIRLNALLSLIHI